LELWVLDREIGSQWAVLRLGFGDPCDVECNAWQASGRAAALPVDDQRGKRAVV
jgi:hypothetical protein